MQTSGLLFIPDISGFTRFVTEMEIEHSRMIMAELLEVVIDANAIGLEISEIEGDAVLFYRFGECPDVRQLSEQVERMFRAFHARLWAFDVTRFCRCRACTSAVHDLTLKIVTHYGEFTSYRVKQFSKLIGRDVIVAHQLLKNDIDHHEYWLATPGLCGNVAAFELPPWVRWSDGVKRTEEGDVPFRHTPLGALRRVLSVAVATAGLDLLRPSEVLAVSREYDTNVFALFRAVGGLDYRSRWQEGVRRVEHARDALPRIGMKSVHVTDDGQTVVYVTGYSFRPDRIVLSETDADRTWSSTFTARQIAPDRARLTIAYHIPEGFLRGLRFRITAKRAMKARLRRSLSSLDGLVEELSAAPVS